MYLLLYNDVNDPLTQTLIQNSDLLNDKLISIDAKDLLNNISINDSIIDGRCTVQWTLPNGEIITNDENTFLINQVKHVNTSWFKDFHPEDIDYATQEFSAYLSFALSSFKISSALPDYLGMNGNQYPLPKQWLDTSRISNEQGITIEFPKYYYGPPRELPESLLKKDFVIGSIFNLYNWKKTDVIDLNDHKDYIFLYSRPNGKPVIGYGYQDQIILNHDSIHQDQQKLISSFSTQLAKQYNYTFFEILFFINDKQITFGMISPNISTPIKYPDAKKMIQFLNHNSTQLNRIQVC